ncbi:MAG TPA: DUF5691 domain-containing protein [Terracidiphilus sp.]
MNAAELKTRVLPKLLAGSRQDEWATDPLISGDAKAALNLLSLCGQAMRFERPIRPAEFAIESWPRDERVIVPQDVRNVMLRLLVEGRCSDDAAQALAWALARCKLRPHPFDLPRLEAFVRSYAECLGATAQFWVQREKPAAQQLAYFDADALNADNWTEAPLARRVRFLEEFRNSDPTAARAALESTWPHETADARHRLLVTMQTGLAAADSSFLESLAKDRAPRVRALAQRLLARLPGAQASNPALAECLSRIQRGKAGVLKKRAALKLELPATVKEHEANRWIYEQFADLNLDELARALEMDCDELINASEEDENLLFALATMASTERRFDLLQRIASGPLPDAWGRMSETGWEEAMAFSGLERERWVTALVHPRKWIPDAPLAPWSWLHKRMEGPLPAPIMREILHAKEWTNRLSAEKPPLAEQIQVFCALSPAECRTLLRDQLQPLEPERTEKGLLLLEILDRLEKPK